MRLNIFMNKQIKPLAGENHLLDIIVINNNVCSIITRWIGWVVSGKKWNTQTGNTNWYSILDSGLNFFPCFKRWNSEKVKSIWTSRKTSYFSPQKFAKIISILCFTCVCYVPQKNLSFSQIDDMTQIICLTTYLLINKIKFYTTK